MIIITKYISFIWNSYIDGVKISWNLSYYLFICVYNWVKLLPISLGLSIKKMVLDKKKKNYF